MPPESELRNSSTCNGLDTETPNEESAPEAVPFEVKAEITYIDVDPSTPNLEEESLVMGPKNTVVLVNAEALPNNLCTKRRRNLPPMDVVNVVVDGSSSSEAIAPMASPERLSPGESVVGSPATAILDLPDSMGSTCLRPRFQLIHEGDLQVCLLNHTRTIVSKVLSSKFLRRWESHHVVLGDTHLSSRTVSMTI